ncbi:hypothetical protein K8R43_00420 [archaeon]|nr:hypothetical protein [archaeon]
MNWIYRPQENPDWGYARNLQAVLKNSSGTWSQSIYSTELNGFIAPNRDCPYQGLTALVNKENWKFLDALFIKALDVSNEIPLTPRKVSLAPWKAEYYYGNGTEQLLVKYSLQNTQELTAKVQIKVSKPVTLLIKPLIDIRPVNEQSQKIKTEKGKNFLISTSNEKSIMLELDGNTNILEEPTRWWYKLGNGFRENTSKGITFKGNAKHPMITGQLQAYGEEFTLRIACDKQYQVRETMLKARKSKSTHALPKLPASLGNTKLDNALKARLYCLQNFDLPVNNVLAPSAGDYWFKQVYFRDAFEGLYNNLRLILKTRGKDYVKNVLEYAMSLQNSQGLIPNYPNNYNSCDATTLCFTLAGEYVKETHDRAFALKALKSLEKAIHGFTNATPAPNGNPSLTEEKLLMCSPWHSWTDAKGTFTIKGTELHDIPYRIPNSWIHYYWKKGKSIHKETLFSDHLLPEINAQWIRMLESAKLMAKQTLSEDWFDMLEPAKIAFLDTFWENDFIINIARNENRDRTLTSMGVVSAVLLEEFMGRKRLKKMRDCVEQLIVYRKDQPFGMLVKIAEERRCYHDRQYHEAVIWPRDTPYLVKYLLLIGEKKTARKLLENQLDHQMTEGAIFYNQELFSLPEGTNPYTKGSKEPIPVKNPIQYWSQFVEPFQWAFT